jgi:hypothetical protein
MKNGKKKYMNDSLDMYEFQEEEVVVEEEVVPMVTLSKKNFELNNYI